MVGVAFICCTFVAKIKCQFYRISWSKPEVSVFKNGSDMANLINSKFCDIT